MKRTSSVLVLLAAAVSSSARADVLHVGGPNPDYTQIRDAVLASVDGDVIRVWGGTYGYFTAAGKSLRILAVAGSGPVIVNGTIRVRDLIVDQYFLMRGVSADGKTDGALVVQDCAGHVRIEDGTFRDPRVTDSDAPAGPGIRVLGSADVAFHSCTGNGGNGRYMPEDETIYGSWGGSGMMVELSTVTLHDCSMTGGYGSSVEQFDGESGGHGVELDASTLYASGSTLRGGDGGDGGDGVSCDGGGYGGYGGDGVYAWASLVRLLDDTLSGGQGGEGGYQIGCSHDAPDGGDGVDVRLGGGSTRQDYSGSAPSMSLPAIGTEGTTVTVSLHGDPFDLVYLLVAVPGYRHTHAWKGTVLLGSGSGGTYWSPSSLIYAGITNSSGARSYSLLLPDLAPFDETTLWIQPLFVDTPASKYIGPASAITVLDSAY